MRYQIREVDAASAKYAAVVARLHAKLFPGIQFPVPHWGHWWVAFLNGEPTAFAQLVQSTYFPNTGYFSRVGVLPDHRGHGLQSRFMGLAERKAIANGWEAIVSDTTKVPHSSANFVKRGWWRFTPDVPWGRAATVYWRIEF